MKELALHMLDIAENSINAGAKKISLSVEHDRRNERLTLKIRDDGSGMSEDLQTKVLDPFFTSRTSRKIGLGIPLLKQHAEMTGGTLSISSKSGCGTEVQAVFNSAHPDIQPLGDIEGCWVLLARSYGELELELFCSTDAGKFSITSKEVKEVLGIESISGNEISEQLKRLIRNNMESIGLV